MSSVKAFVTRDDFINNNDNTISDVFELSDYGYTFSPNRKEYYYSSNPLYTLHHFNTDEINTLSQTDVDNFLSVVDLFFWFVNRNLSSYNNDYIIASFMNYMITADVTYNIAEFNLGKVITAGTVKAADYIIVRINEVTATLWMNYESFETFYPNYVVQCVLPVDNFATIVNSSPAIINELTQFDYSAFVNKLQTLTNKRPPTAIRILNIPYTITATQTTVNCYFGFIIYGSQGDHEYLLKLKLLDYLSSLGINQTTILTYFPLITQINEFFIIPRWKNIAIPSQVGQAAINSQVLPTFNATYDLDKLLPAYNNENFIRNNTYSVPFAYNNIIAYVVNGLYSSSNVKDFKTYYSDLITVDSLSPDFARMSQRTQNFVSMVMEALQIADSKDDNTFLNAIFNNNNYNFKLVNRNGANYLTVFLAPHQYYILPYYEFVRLLS